MTIYEELLTAANDAGAFEVHGTQESDAAYLMRFASRLSNIPHSVWVRLSSEAARWCNAAGARINLGTPIDVECPGFADAKLIDAANEDTEQVELRPRAHIALVDQAPDLNCRIAESLKSTDAIHAMVNEHPDWTQAQIAKALGNGVSTSTIARCAV